MKAFILAALAMVLLVSACVKQPATGEQTTGSLGVQEQGSGLGELPSGQAEDTGLTGEQVDLGSPV